MKLLFFIATAIAATVAKVESGFRETCLTTEVEKVSTMLHGATTTETCFAQVSAKSFNVQQRLNEFAFHRGKVRELRFHSRAGLERETYLA